MKLSLLLHLAILGIASVLSVPLSEDADYALGDPAPEAALLLKRQNLNVTVEVSYSVPYTVMQRCLHKIGNFYGVDYLRLAYDYAHTLSQNGQKVQGTVGEFCRQQRCLLLFRTAYDNRYCLSVAPGFHTSTITGRMLPCQNAL